MALNVGRSNALCRAAPIDYNRPTPSTASAQAQRPADRRTADDDDAARLGLALLRQAIEPTLTPADPGRFVCVDVDTAVYELADDDLTAVDRLLARHPAADTYLGRVGDSATFRLIKA